MVGHYVVLAVLLESVRLFVYHYLSSTVTSPGPPPAMTVLTRATSSTCVYSGPQARDLRPCIEVSMNSCKRVCLERMRPPAGLNGFFFLSLWILLSAQGNTDPAVC